MKSRLFLKIRYLPTWDDRQFYGQAVGVITLGLLLYRLSQGALPGFLIPPQLFPGSDLLSQLLVSWGVIPLVFHPIAGWIFTFLLISSAIGMIAKPKHILPFAAGFVLFCLYIVSFNTALGHFYHNLVGFPLLMLPFIFRKKQSYRLAWEFSRFYLVYIMVSAALWKIFRGAAWHSGHLSKVLFQQNGFDWIKHPDSLSTMLGQFLFQNPGIANLSFALLILLQLSFALALFTRRFDKYLLFGLVMFFVLNSLIMGINSWAMIILALPLLGSRRNLSAKLSAQFL